MAHDPHDPSSHRPPNRPRGRAKDVRDHPGRPRHRDLGVLPLLRPRPSPDEATRRGRLRAPHSPRRVRPRSQGRAYHPRRPRLVPRGQVRPALRFKESPFTQASTCMHELERCIKSDFVDEKPARALFGFGVAFPDVEFTKESPEWDNRSRLRRPRSGQAVHFLHQPSRSVPSLSRQGKEASVTQTRRHRRASAIPSR